jgi:restriction system protein
MSLLEDGPIPPFFVGRAKELYWLEQRFREGRHGTTIQIVGPPGVGKTALLQRAIYILLPREEVIVMSTNQGELDLDRLSYQLRNNDRKRTRAVAVDDVDLIAKQIDELHATVFNWKSIRTLLLSSRQPLHSRRNIHTLRLEPLNLEETTALFKLLSQSADRSIPEQLASISEGMPLAIHLIARLLETHDPKSLLNMLQGFVYNLQNQIQIPERQLITIVKPKLVVVNERILERLRSRPEDIHQIGHRKFEELVAELLHDMNFDVELTQATRDGGRDVLAYWNSPLGRLLMLVEAKKHRPDRPVGIQLVRTLYGTLMDEQANSAMLVTTADFSPDARKFEAKHNWQLALKNYTDLVEWIDNYKKPKPKKIILPH